MKTKINIPKEDKNKADQIVSLFLDLKLSTMVAIIDRLEEIRNEKLEKPKPGDNEMEIKL